MADDDVKDIQRRLKEMELRAKLNSKMEKKKEKEEKVKMKLMKMQEKMRKKLAKQGKTLPEDLKKEELERGKEAVGVGEKIVKAEVVEFKPKEWERRSVQSMNDVEKKIDRFTGKGVASLSDRYREKYGESLKVPELYQIETSLEMESDLDKVIKDDELEKLESELEGGRTSRDEGFGNSSRKATIEVEEPEGPKPDLKFMDLSSGFLYFKEKFAARGGAGKKAVFIKRGKQ
jgi:hypothetical protein